MATKTSVKKTEAIVVFTDIRGFTNWSENIEVFQHSSEFILDFYNSLKKHFKSWYCKHLGDGTLFIKALKGQEYKTIIINVVKNILEVNAQFETFCKAFAEKRGQETNLLLGWGIARGTVNKIEKANDFTEYIGATINKAARLCDIARPHGIVIDAKDFSNMQEYQNLFSIQKRQIRSIDKVVDIWVTNAIASSFHRREDVKETPEVHIAGFCIREEKETIKVLIAKRNDDRTLYPSLYEGCGGQLKSGETFEAGVVRHFSSEMGVLVAVYEKLHTFYVIREPSQPCIQGVAFLCRYLSGEPKSNNHSELKWVDIKELKNMEDQSFIPNVKNEIISLVERYKESKKENF